MMASRFTLILLFVLFSCKLNTGIGEEKLSREYLELEKQFKLWNKPAVTIIKTIHGEKYKCVDFYKQPAFDHPALKNHTFHPEMRSITYPKRKIYEDYSTTNMYEDSHQSFGHLWQNGKGCPIGTVPIKKMSKDDFINARMAAEIYAEKYEPSTIQEPGTHYAVLRTNSGTGKNFNGGGMATTVYNPGSVTGSQYSSSQVKIVKGGDSIETGWTANPSLYKDSRPRLFIYTNVAASRCYNTECPGFVLVRADLHFDKIISPISKIRGDIYGKTLHIRRDPPNGNWWLEIGPNLAQVGFWPRQIFAATGLAGMATFIEWGGKAYSPITIPSPPMGSGYDLTSSGDVSLDAHCRYVVTINEASEIVDATETSTFADIKQYQVLDKGIYRDLGHLVYYGGSGGYVGN